MNNAQSKAAPKPYAALLSLSLSLGLGGGVGFNYRADDTALPLSDLSR